MTSEKNLIVKLLALVFLLLIINSCSKQKIGEINNLNDNKIGIIGHGGNGFQGYDNPLPHNSFGSISKAIDSYNADGAEIDVQLSADYELFLYHDNKLRSMTECEGCIYSQNAATLKNCTYRNSKEKIVSLDSVLSYFNKRSVKPKIFLDMRTASECNTTDQNEYIGILSSKISEIIRKYQGWDWIIVEAQDMSFLKMMKEKEPSAKLVLDFTGNIEETISFADSYNLYGVVFSNKDASEANIRLAHEKGLFVSLFEIQTRKENFEAINKSPDFIQTDNIPLLQQLLNY